MRIALPSSLFAGLMTAALLASCNNAPQPQATTAPSGPTPVNVTLAPAREMDLQRTVSIVGSLAGLETASLSNRVTGTVSKIYFDRGDRVKPGAKLLEIEPDRYQMAVHEAEGALQQTLARLGIKEVPDDNFDINQTAPVKKAQSDYENAKSKYDRATPLNQSKAMNDFEYLDIASAYKSAESALESSRDDARALLAQARQNRTTIQMRSKDFGDSVILAPDGTTPDGVQKIETYAITDRKVSVGEYLREGTILFTLVADNTLKLQAHIPERYLGDLYKNATVTFRVEAYPDEPFTGQVAIINPAVDAANRTFMIEALVDNAHYGHRLRPGSFVPGEVLTHKDPHRVMVPLKAIASSVGITKVFKLDPSTTPAHPRVLAVDVVTGQQESIKDADGQITQWIEIVSTGKGQQLTGNDQLVISGITKVVDGSLVTIDNPAQTGAAAAKTD